MVRADIFTIIKDSGLENLASVAKVIIDRASSNICILKGEMGTGKTTLVREICNLLDVVDNVSSPTFSLVNEYRAEKRTVYHFDFYRVNSLEEALDAGVEDYFYSGNLCVIEWPEIIKTILPNDFLEVEIYLADNDQRNYKLTTHESV